MTLNEMYIVKTKDITALICFRPMIYSYISENIRKLQAFVFRGCRSRTLALKKLHVTYEM